MQKTCMVLQKIQFQAPSHLLFVAAASVAAPSGVVVQVAVAAHGPAAARLAALTSAVAATCDTLAPRWARSSPPGWLNQATAGASLTAASAAAGTIGDPSGGSVGVPWS
jgi:hypothetical protein